MDPINYTIDVQTPFQAAIQGYQAGAAIRNDQAQQQQQQAALQAQQQRQQLLAGLAAKSNPTAGDYASVMTQLPDVAEQLQKAWTTRNAAQQQAHASDLLQWGAAIKSGQPQIAADQMVQRAEAMERTAGGGQASVPTEESQALRANAKVLLENPALALGKIQAMLAVNPNGKDAAESLAKFGSEARADRKFPSELAKSEAEAAKAGVEARYAEQQAVLDLQKKGWDIRHIQADIDLRRDANRIAAMNAAASREGNTLKREELGLKIQEARSALDDKIRSKVAETEGAAASIDNALNTIQRIKTNKSLDSVLGSFEGRMPAVFSDDASDAIALIETLGSQTFLSMIPAMKGTGSLTEREGDKLQSALTNLSRTQSETQFRANLDEASRLLKKGRETISKRTGVPLGAPDTPAEPGSRPPLSSFVRRSGSVSSSY